MITQLERPLQDHLKSRLFKDVSGRERVLVRSDRLEWVVGFHIEPDGCGFAVKV